MAYTKLTLIRYQLKLSIKMILKSKGRKGALTDYNDIMKHPIKKKVLIRREYISALILTISVKD